MSITSTTLIATALVCAAVPRASAQLWFEDVSDAAGIDATFVPGPNYQIGLAYLVAGGATGDFDNDGRPDLFVISGGTEPDRLYMNRGDGTFVDEAADWGLTDLHMGAGAAVGDYDGDGHLDLFVTSFGDAAAPITNGAHRLYRNTGARSFVNVAAAAGVAANDVVPNAYGAAFGDYDLDGDLDLFVTGWATNGIGGNRLYRNDGDGTFTDVTVAAGVFDIEVHGFSPRFVDMDGDLHPELLLAADFETSRYYVNNGDGTFTDFTGPSGTGLDCNGMGATVADFDNDGRFDWYVTNIYNFSVPRNPCGNMLYMNQGNHQYVETAAAAGVIHGWWGWGTVAVDFDHDGWPDLAEVNGYFDDSFNQVWGNRPARLWINAADGTFNEVAEACNFGHTGQGRGLLNFDYDLDGDQDLVVFSAPDPNAPTDPVRLYRNDLVSTHGWLRITLDTTTNSELAPNGFGTRVSVTTGPTTRCRVIDGGSNYMSQSELSAHFGLGPAATADEVRVEWANGMVTTLTNVAVNRTLTITAPFRPGDVDEDGTVGLGDLLAILSSWGPCAACPEDVDGDGNVGLGDLLVVLSGWG